MRVGHHSAIFAFQTLVEQPEKCECHMIKTLKKFFLREDGAVTVDWVVLTAALVGLAAAAGSTVLSGVNTASSSVETAVSTKSVNNGD
jgi:Flp pilus assembly pilin Flp